MLITQLFQQALVLNPDGLSTVFESRTRTWRETHDRVARAGTSLANLSQSSDSFIAVLAMNSDRYLELFFAIPWAGYAIAPMNIRWSSLENLQTLEDCGAHVLLVDEHFKEQGLELARHRTLSLIYIGDGETPPGMLNYEALLEATSPLPEAQLSPQDLFAVFYTGGTTGSPKGVAFTHQSLCQASVAYLAMLPDTEDMRFAYVGGFFHFSAASHLLYTTLAGGSHIILPKFEPEPMMKAISQHSATNAVMVPTMITSLLNHPDFAKHDLSSMRTLVYGGSPIARELLEEAARKLPGWRFFQIYGMTETGGFATMLRWRDHLFEGPAKHRILSCGQPAPGVEVRICDPQGAELPRGELGEIVMRSDYVMLKYLGKPAETAETLREGWIHSGDAGYMDEDGYLYVADRIKDMIVSGGENVYSIEVERALYAHHAVLQAAVIGIPSPQWGEAVHAIVLLRVEADADEAKLIAHCRELIGAYKCPKSIEFVTSPLPTGPAGKIQKAKLRAQYWQDETDKLRSS